MPEVTWEYTIKERVGWLSGDHPTTILNQMGAEGWEVFHVEAEWLWFKRQVTITPEEDS